MEKQAAAVTVNVKALVLVGALIGFVVGFFVGFFLSNRWNAEALRQAGFSPTPKASAQGQMPEGHPPIDPQQQMEMVRQKLEEWKKLAAEDPKNFQVRAQLGNIYFDVGKYQEAIQWYDQALQIDPTNTNVRTDMATAYHYLGQHDRAIAELEKVLSYDPKHAHALVNLGIVKRDGKRDYKGAIEAWERLMATNPNFPHLEEVRRWMDEIKAMSEQKR